MNARPYVPFVGLFLIAAPLGSALRAQQGPALIRQGIAAYNDFDPERALPLLRRGVDPNAGPRDSVWALGVQYVAQILYEQGDEPSAGTWIRWAVRLVPDLPLDTLNLLSNVLAEFRRAREATVAGPGDARVTTEWVWPVGDPASGPGRVEARSADASLALQVALADRGDIGRWVTLRAGTYEIEARAPEHHPARAVREVLPGITTILTFTLDPAGLTADARRRVRERIAVLSTTHFGAAEAGCPAAVLVGDEGLLLTTYRAIRGAERIGARIGASADSVLAVAAYDVQRDLAVLQLTGVAAAQLPIARQPTGTQPAWVFGLAGCDSVTESRVRLVSGGAGGDPLRLEGEVTGVLAGSPIVDSTGALLGLAREDSSVLAAAAAADLIARARSSVAAGTLLSPADVASAERHRSDRYGAITVTAPPGVTATAVVTPQEPWHWPELAASGELPLRFTGPEGRYRVVVTEGQRVRYDSVVAVLPGIQEELAIPTAPVAMRKKRRFPWVIAVLGAVGAGTAAVLLTGKEDTPPPSTTGSIRIRIPNP